MKKFLSVMTLAALIAAPALASVRIDIRNESSEDCSLAINARTDKTRWLTEGWYVYAAGEEAPIILDDVNDLRTVYIYNDCQRKTSFSGSETKKVWVKTNLMFHDEAPQDNKPGYEEVVFTRLNDNKYVILAN